MTPKELNSLRFSSKYSSVARRFQGRFDVRPYPDYFTVDLASSRITVDKTLASLFTIEDDVVLWILAARSMILLRSVVGSRATTHFLRLWEFGWVMKYAADHHKLPTKVLNSIFNSNGTVLERLLSLDWVGIRDLSPEIWARMQKAYPSYNDWMDLGESLQPQSKGKGKNKQKDAPSDPDTQETGKAETSKVDEDDNLPRCPNLLPAEKGSECPASKEHAGSVYWQAVPKTGREDVQWVLATSLASESDPYTIHVPNTQVMSGLKRLRLHDDPDYEIQRFGQIGKREIVKFAIGAPNYFGTKVEPRMTEEFIPWKVYVDVSGSMVYYLPLVWPIVASLPEGTIVQAFSGILAPTAIDVDRVKTNGYTDYDIVARDILQGPSVPILVFSDSDACIRPSLLQQLTEYGADITYIDVREPPIPLGGFKDVATTYINIHHDV